MNCRLRNKYSIGLFFLLFFSVCAAGRENRPAPDFDLFDSENSVFRLSRQKGNCVLLCFFDPHYPVCQKQLDDLNFLQKFYKHKKIIFAGIVINPKISADSIKTMIMEKKITFTILRGTKKVIKEYENIRVIPSCFLIDQKGNIAEVNRGYWLIDELKNKIDQHLGINGGNKDIDLLLKEK